MSKRRPGSKNYTRLHRARWEATRKQVFQRDGYKCRLCGHRGRLEAHHEPPMTAGGDPYDIDGILTVCRNCHIDRHRYDNVSPERLAWIKFVEELTG